MENDSLLKTIRIQRIVKEDGREISLHGFIGKDGERFYDQAEELLVELREENRDFEDKYITPLKDGYLSEIRQERVDMKSSC